MQVNSQILNRWKEDFIYKDNYYFYKKDPNIKLSNLDFLASFL